MFENSHDSASVPTTRAISAGPGLPLSSPATATRMMIITSPVSASSPTRLASLALACSRIALASAFFISGMTEIRNKALAASNAAITPRAAPSGGIATMRPIANATQNSTKRGGAMWLPTLQRALCVVMDEVLAICASLA